MRRSRSLVWLAALGLLGLLSSAWLVGSIKSAPSPSSVGHPTGPATDVVLPTQDGVRIAGTFWHSANPARTAILLLHGNDASREAMFAAGDWAYEKGYSVLAIDFRGHGESDLREHSFGYFEARDTQAALAWLRAKGFEHVGVIGSSLGGASVLIGEDGPVEVDALVLQAVYPDIRSAIFNRIAFRTGRLPAYVLEPLLSFQSRARIGVWPSRLSPLKAISTYHRPVMIVGGSEDTSTPVLETRELFAAAHAPKRIWIAPGRAHGDMVAGTEDDWKRQVGNFLAYHLPLDAKR